ncbi:MAG: HEAT repeat domain-containing protein [Anaerolineae bacterium]|nr:HEAT repeat domain-containing protein [Anaerolineae bacterium]
MYLPDPQDLHHHSSANKFDKSRRHNAELAAHVSFLIEELINPNRSVRENAKNELVALGDLALDDLLAALMTRNDQYQWRILPVLGAMGGTRAMRGVMTCLESGNTAIRSAAAQILGKSGHLEAVDALLAQLKRPENAGSLVAVLGALGQIGDRRVVPALVSIMHRTDVPSVRYTAIEALGKLGDRGVMDEIQRYVDDPSHHVRTRARDAIHALNTPEVRRKNLLAFDAD